MSWRGRRSSGGGGGARWLESKFAGACAACGKSTRRGELVYWRGPGAGVLCESCARESGLGQTDLQRDQAAWNYTFRREPAMDAANEYCAERASLDAMGESLSYGGGQW